MGSGRVGSCQTYRFACLLGFPEPWASTLAHCCLLDLGEGEALATVPVTAKLLGRMAPTPTHKHSIPTTLLCCVAGFPSLPALTGPLCH